MLTLKAELGGDDGPRKLGTMALQSGAEQC